MTNLQGIRCVSNYNSSTVNKIQNWCKNTGKYTNTSADEGYCFGTTPNTYTSDNKTLSASAMPRLWGDDKNCEWSVGDEISVSIHVTAQHKGTHFVDFVPQNPQQLEGLPPCPGSKDARGNVAPFKKNRIADFEVCYQDHVHYADGKGQNIPDWQRKSIRLHPAFALVDEKEATKSPEFNMKFYAANGPGPSTSSSRTSSLTLLNLPSFVGFGSADTTLNVIARLQTAHGCIPTLLPETLVPPTAMLVMAP